MRDHNLMFFPVVVGLIAGMFLGTYISYWFFTLIGVGIIWDVSLGLYFMWTRPYIWEVPDEESLDSVSEVLRGQSVNILAKVTVSIKPTVNDPQGLSIAKALRESLGFTEVEGVRAGKSILIRLSCEDLDLARERVEDMCKKLLANPVIETYSFEVEPADDRS